MLASYYIVLIAVVFSLFFFFKQKTAYEMRISDWSSDVCSSDLLPVKTYKTIDDAIDYVNDHDRPLGLYYFGQDKSEEDRVLTRTISGGVTVNDVLFHNAMEDLPLDRKSTRLNSSH